MQRMVQILDLASNFLPRSAQILFAIGTAVAMLVNAHSSNYKPNQEADRDPKRLLEHDSLLCEQAHDRTWLSLWNVIRNGTGM